MRLIFRLRAVKFRGRLRNLLRGETFPPSSYSEHLRQAFTRAFTPSIYAKHLREPRRKGIGWLDPDAKGCSSQPLQVRPTASPASIAGYAHVDTARRLHARHGRNFCDAFALRPGRHAARISWHRVSCRKTCSAGDLTPCSPAVARRGRCIRARFERLRRLRQPSAPSTASVRARPP